MEEFTSIGEFSPMKNNLKLKVHITLKGFDIKARGKGGTACPDEYRGPPPREKRSTEFCSVV